MCQVAFPSCIGQPTDWVVCIWIHPYTFPFLLGKYSLSPQTGTTFIKEGSSFFKSIFQTQSVCMCFSKMGWTDAKQHLFMWLLWGQTTDSSVQEGKVTLVEKEAGRSKNYNHQWKIQYKTLSYSPHLKDDQQLKLNAWRRSIWLLLISIEGLVNREHKGRALSAASTLF